MKSDWSDIESNRTSPRGWESKTGDRFGWFVWLKGKTQIRAMVADGEATDWEHVSISVAYLAGNTWTPRTPKWEEMCWVKSLFWNPDECVIQYHPPEKDYVNTHNHCLHLWRPVHGEIPMPPKIMV